MQEISRIVIEGYCRTHKSKKSEKLARLVELSYDVGCGVGDGDAIFLERTIQREKDLELREALEDLDDFLFGW